MKLTESHFEEEVKEYDSIILKRSVKDGETASEVLDTPSRFCYLYLWKLLRMKKMLLFCV